MDVYTFYTDSHLELYQKLNKSVSLLCPSLNLITRKFDQECLTGEYMSPGWGETMRKKVDLILEAIDQGKIFIHSDCDVVYLQDPTEKVLEELGDYDLAFQSDFVPLKEVWYCMGFFVCRPSQRTRDLFVKVYENIGNFWGNDQLSLNNILSTYKNPSPGKGFEDLKYKTLSEKFFTYGQTGKSSIWDGEQFDLPEDLVAFHANWTKGTQRKINLIDYVLTKKGIKL